MDPEKSAQGTADGGAVMGGGGDGGAVMAGQ